MRAESEPDPIVARPAASVIVPTRNRPLDLARCLPSILANDCPDFEVIVIDQSVGTATQEVVCALAGEGGCHTTEDPGRVAGSAPTCAFDLYPSGKHMRVVYVHSAVMGASHARNVGISLARASVLLFTDDDCTVPEHWIRRATGVLTENPSAPVVFGALRAAPHDPRAHFVPTFVPPQFEVLSGRLTRAHLSGVSANLAVTRRAASELDGFDERLGPGSAVNTGEDCEFAFRALRAGFAIVQDPENVVLHWGKREYANGAANKLVRVSHFAIGVGYALHARRGDWAAAWLILQELVLLSVKVPKAIVQGRRTIGLGRLGSFAAGVARGLAG